MDLIADRGRRVTVEELNTTRLLAHARKQAHQRNFDDMVIVDVDAHHYENENYDEFLPFMENDVLRQLTMSGRKRNRAGITPTQVGYQDMGGRVTRYPMRGSVETELCWAYNRWLTEKIMPEADNRFFSMLCLPFNDPEAALRHVETFGDRKHVGGFMVTTVRSNMGVQENAYMKVYRAIEERGLVLSFHSRRKRGEPIYKSCNRFISAHALGFTWYNVVHCTNWVINGMGERFPKL